LLVPVIGVANVLWISILAFLIAWYLLDKSKELNTQEGHAESHHHVPPPYGTTLSSWAQRLFEHRLIFFISLWSVVAFTIYAFLDFTFLIEIKGRYHSQQQLAAFIGIFFTIGRFLAIIFKLLLSSRLISRIGLANALLISPVVLLVITGFILLRQDEIESLLYIFGVMVLLSEVLRSAVQDPAFFVLFQPLKPHLRLKGHLIAKGYTMPFALFGAGVFLEFYLKKNGHISIAFISQTLMVLLVTWIITVYLIKKEYLATLIKAIQKGYFTGTELFLNNKPIRDLLLTKTHSNNPKEVIYALDLLERSGLKNISHLWLQLLPNAPDQVKIYLINRIIINNLPEALPSVEKLLANAPEQKLRLSLIQASYYLQKDLTPEHQASYYQLNTEGKKAAILGLLSQKEGAPRTFAEQELASLAESSRAEDKLLAIAIISELPKGSFNHLLRQLVADEAPVICKKAILAVGKTQNLSLLPNIVEKANQLKFYSVLQNSLLLAGD